MKKRSMMVAFEIETDAPLSVLRKVLPVEACLALEHEHGYFARPCGRAGVNVAESSKQQRVSRAAGISGASRVSGASRKQK